MLVASGHLSRGTSAAAHSLSKPVTEREGRAERASQRGRNTAAKQLGLEGATRLAKHQSQTKRPHNDKLPLASNPHIVSGCWNCRPRIRFGDAPWETEAHLCTRRVSGFKTTQPRHLKALQGATPSSSSSHQVPAGPASSLCLQIHSPVALPNKIQETDKSETQMNNEYIY